MADNIRFGYDTLNHKTANQFGPPFQGAVTESGAGFTHDGNYPLGVYPRMSLRSGGRSNTPEPNYENSQSLPVDPNSPTRRERMEGLQLEANRGLGRDGYPTEKLSSQMKLGNQSFPQPTQSMRGEVDSSGYTEDEYRSIGNEFLKLIGPTILGQEGNGGGGNQTPQNRPPNQSPGPQRKMVDGALPSPEVLKSFSKGMAPKLRSVLEGYGSQMQRGGQMAPQQMVPPQFMGNQMPMGNQMQMTPQNPNIYRNLNQPPQMQQGPFQSFNPYQTSVGGN